MRQIGRAIVTVAVALTAIIVPAAPALAAEPVVTVEAASIMSPPSEMIVNGYATCSQPTGPAQIDVLAMQFSGGFPSGQGSTTITCGPGPVAWAVTVTTNTLGPWLSGQLVFGSATLITNETPETYSCICVVA